MSVDPIRKNSHQYLLRTPPPAKLDDVRRQRRRNRLQPIGNGERVERAHVGHWGAQRRHRQQLLHVRHQPRRYRGLSQRVQLCRWPAGSSRLRPLLRLQLRGCARRVTHTGKRTVHSQFTERKPPTKSDFPVPYDWVIWIPVIQSAKKGVFEVPI